MKKRLLVVLSITMIAVLLFSGCGNSNSNTGEGSGNELASKEVTVILKNLTNPFWISVKEGVEAAGEELGVNVKVLAPLKADNNEEQSLMVEQAIANQTDIVVLTPSDSNGIIPAAKKLNEAGIPIVNLNTKIEGNTVDVETFIAIENYDAGFETVKRLCEMIEGSGEIIIIEGVTGAQTSIDRVKGAIDSLAEYPGVELVAQQSGDYNRAIAMDVVQNLLQAHPDVNAIFCCNDEMALGAVEAIASAGKTGEILVAGIDANDDARQAIKEGKMALSCDSQPFNQGYQGVVNAVKVLQGEELDDFIKLDMKVVGKEDLD